MTARGADCPTAGPIGLALIRSALHGIAFASFGRRANAIRRLIENASGAPDATALFGNLLQGVDAEHVTQEIELKGHIFAKLVEGQIKEKKTESIKWDGTAEGYYSPISEVHFNCFADGMLSISGFLKGFYNVFDLDESELKCDAEKNAADIAAVGEIPYEMLARCGSCELYERNDFGWFGVSLAKGLTTIPEMINLFDFFRPYFIGESAEYAA